MIQIIIKMIKSMLADSDLSVKIWPELVDTAVYLRIRIPNKHLNSKTPFGIIYRKKLDLFHLREIGCVCYAQIPNEKRSGLDFNTSECRLLDYAASTQYKLYKVEIGQIIYSHDIIFDKLAPTN